MPKEYPTFNVTGKTLSRENEPPIQTPKSKIDQIYDIDELRQFTKALQRQLAVTAQSELTRLKSAVENLENQLKCYQEETTKWKNLYLQAARVQVQVTESDKDAIISRLQQELYDAGKSKAQSEPRVPVYDLTYRRRRPSSSASYNPTSGEEKSNDVTPKTEGNNRTFGHNYISPYAYKPPKKQKYLSPLEHYRLVYEYVEESMLSCYNLTPLVEYVGMDVKTGKIYVELPTSVTDDFDKTDEVKYAPSSRYNRMNQGFTEMFSDKDNMAETCFGDTMYAPDAVGNSATHPQDGDISLIPNCLTYAHIDSIGYSYIIKSSSTTTLPFTYAFPLTVDVEEPKYDYLESMLAQHFGLCRELLFVQQRVGQTLFIGSSFLRKEICRLLEDRKIKFSGLQLCSCMVYGKTSRERIQKTAQGFNFFDIKTAENGYEVVFENEADAQRFYTLGQVEFANNGIKGLTIARKAKQ